MKNGNNYALMIRQFKDVVSKKLKPFDWTLLDDIASLCTNFGNSNPEWTYHLEELKFPRASIKEYGLDHTRPTSVRSFSITLSVKAEGDCNSESETGDPMKHLVVDVAAFGYKVAVATTPSEIRATALLVADMDCAWHLDSHPPKGSTGRFDSDFAHPRYHWQYGGDKIWSNTTDWFGQHLLLESPRLIHPPMDIVLAIDFVLANFYSLIWSEVRSEPAYQRVIASARELYWKPYFQKISQINWSKQASNQLDYLY